MCVNTLGNKALSDSDSSWVLICVAKILDWTAEVTKDKYILVNGRPDEH